MKFYGGNILGPNVGETFAGTATSNVVRITTDGQGLVDVGELTIGRLQSESDRNFYLSYNSLAFPGIVLAADPAWPVNFTYSTLYSRFLSLDLVAGSYYLRCTMGAGLPRGRGLFHYTASFVYVTDDQEDTFPSISIVYPSITTNTSTFLLGSVENNVRYPIQYSHSIVSAYERVINTVAQTNSSGDGFDVLVDSIDNVSIGQLNGNIYTITGCIPVGWIPD
jgi:hypothetical protein